MFIERIHVEGFGPFDDFHCDGLRPGVVLVQGPNEAGKSTLRHFVRWMLFGSQHGDLKRWTNCFDRLGGEIGLRQQGAAKSLVRRRSEVELRLSDAVRRGEEAAKSLVGGMDLALFDAIFTFDLFDLRRIEIIQDEHVQNLLAVGATLGGGVHPVEVLRALARDADAYWRPRARDVLVRQAEHQLAQRREGLYTATEAAKAYESLIEDVAHIDGHLAALRDAYAAKDKELRELELHHRTWPAWSERSERLAEVTALGPDEALESDVRIRIEELQRQRSDSGRELQEAKDGLDEVRSELAAIRVDDRLISHAAEIEALDDRRAALEELATNRQALESELEELQAQSAAQLEELGLGWTRERVIAVRIDAHLEVEAQGHADRTAKLEEQVPASVARAEEALLQAQKELADVDEELRQVAPRPLDAREDDVLRLLTEAQKRLAQHDERGAEQDQLAKLRGTPLEPVEGWPELEESHVQDLDRWQATWRSEASRHRDRVADAKKRLEDAELELAGAREALKQAEALPGADAPSRQAVAALQAQWPSMRDDLMKTQALTEEQEKLVKALSHLPATLGSDVTLEQLAAVDRSAQTRSQLSQAHRALEEAKAARLRARAALEALGAPPVSSPPDPEVEAAVVERRRRLLEARSALETYQQLLGQAGTGARSRPPARLRWLGPLLFLSFAIAAAALSQALLTFIAMTAALLLSVITWRAGRGEVEGTTTSLSAAKRTFLDAARRAGLDGEPTRGKIDELLEDVRSQLAGYQRAQEEAKLAEEARGRRERATEELRTAESDLEARCAELASRLEEATLPKALDGALTAAWLDAAGELASLRRRRGEVQRELTQAEARGEGFREALAELATVGSCERRRVEAALASLEARRAAADTREQALNEQEARAREATKAVARARKDADALAAQDEVPSELTASYTTWLESKGIPCGPPTTTVLDEARRMLRYTGWRRDVEAREARVRELSVALAPFEETLRELGALASLPAGDGVAASIEGLREAREEASARRATREELQKRRARILEQAGLAEQEQRDGQRRQQELIAARDEFLAWSRRAAAPSDLPPASAEKWIERVKRAQDVEQTRDTRRRELDTLTDRTEAFMDAASRVAAALQDPPVERRLDLVAGSVRRWRGLLDDARSAHARRKDHKERVRVAEERLQRKESTYEELSQRWVRAIEKIGCADEASWSARLDRYREREELLARLGATEAQLKGALGTRWDDASRWTRPESRDALEYEARRHALELELETLKDDIEERVRERGEKDARARDLEVNADVAERSQELASAQVELEGARREWWRLQIAAFLLEDTFQRFRRERQPAVLRRASEWFCRATEGAYQALEVEESASSAPSFQVKARDGSRHPADGLSTGTTGLLYLCLRMALALDQARQIAAVPMLLDDVLAHFDPERSRAAARLIREVARDEAELQLLVFSCRPETEQTLREVDEALHVIRLPRWAGADQPPGRRGGAQVRRSTATTTPSDRAPTVDASEAQELLTRALDLLLDRNAPLARSDFVRTLELEDHLWGTLRPLLEAHERIEVSGTGRGRRYRAAT
jgi:uncharacterized protein YhaN